MNTATKSIGPQSKMSEVLQAYPGAQRAMFRKYHIGGCSNCGFQMAETLEQVCQRNNNLNLGEVLEHIKTSHEQDEKILISAKDLAELLKQDQAPRLLDIRSRDEFNATHIDGSILLSQPIMQEILASWDPQQPFVLIDHEGKQGLDAAAYFTGHGFKNVRCLRGGLDAWSQEVDPNVRRYQLA
jgi:rhodanese-related sulfurtransferase